MDFSYSEKSLALAAQLRTFMEENIVPNIRVFDRAHTRGEFPLALIQELKAKAKAEGLWNLFLPALTDDEPGTRLSNLDYAPLAEIMGRVHWSSEVFNCNPPDTGNMELLHLFATPEQRERWLNPLLNGEIRSVFSMTEPEVASSDATNIRTSIRRDGDHYIVSGRKWFSSAAMHPLAKFAIVMGVSDDSEGADPHRRQSMIIVPLDTPGVKILRDYPILNYRMPDGITEMLYDNVRVPASMLLGNEGDVSAIKLVTARVLQKVSDRAMQVFGGAGLTPDTPLAFLFTWGRAMRFFDGPDEVHLRGIARVELKRAKANPGFTAPYLTPFTGE